MKQRKAETEAEAEVKVKVKSLAFTSKTMVTLRMHSLENQQQIQNKLNKSTKKRCEVEPEVVMITAGARARVEEKGRLQHQLEGYIKT